MSTRPPALPRTDARGPRPARRSRRRALGALLVSALAVLPACSAEEQTPAPATSSAALPAPTTTQPTPTSTSTPPAPTTTAPPAPATSDTAPTSAPEPTPRSALDAQGISTGDPLATQAGLDILADGGTAVDASIAAALVDAVMQPGSSGIGGGGAAIVVTPDGEAINYDFRDAAGPDGRTDGRTGVPGLVAGLALLHEEHGSLPWAELVQPAIDVAAQGAPMSTFTADLLDTPLGENATRELAHFRDEAGAPLRAGDLLVQTELAQTLQVLADEGPDSFYTGSIAADLLAADVQSAQALAAYEVRVSDPVAGPVGEFQVLSGAPGLSGVPLIETLQIMQAGGAADLPPTSTDLVDLQVRAWALAEQDRIATLGDPGAVRLPSELLDPERNADLVTDLPGVAGAGAVLPTGAAGRDGGVVEEPHSTTHISAVDAEGAVVSMTNTVSENWGSGEYVGGFFLNNHLDLFDGIPGEGNVSGPGRRPVSRMAPTVLLDAEDRPVLVIGAPGGEQIPQSLTTVIVRWALQGQGLQDAVDQPRVRVRGGATSGRSIRVEEPAWVQPLRDRGFGDIAASPSQDAHLYSSVQVLQIDWEGRGLIGATDSRRSALTSVIAVD